MNRIKVTGMAITLLYGCVLLTAQEQETPPVSLEKVSEGVYQIRGGSGANGGIITGDRGILVIDSKMNEESVRQSIAAIQEISDQPIIYLVNTHSDGDHIMGNRYFPASVTFIAHTNCRDDFFKENFGRDSDWEDCRSEATSSSVTGGSFEASISFCSIKPNISPSIRRVSGRRS